MKRINIFDHLPHQQRTPRGENSSRLPKFQIGEMVRVSGGPLNDDPSVVLDDGVWCPRFPATSVWKVGPLQVRPIYE